MPSTSLPVPPEPSAAISLEPRLVERVWGADSLGPWYPQPQPGKPIGEVWLTAEECKARGSELTLAEVVQQQGSRWGSDAGEGFPLLIKLLYPREKLSVQVHPNDAQAQAAHNQPRGKTECWYVVSAEPGAAVAVGFREPMTVAEVQRAIEDGTVEQRLRMLPVKAGDMVFVDAGTVHAIGPGVVVLETQQYSDITYRIWDYGRPRELHVAEGLAVTRTETAAGLVPPTAMGGFDRLVRCPFFIVDRFHPAPGAPAQLRSEEAVQVLIPLGEGMSLRQGDGAALPLAPGHAVVIPARGPSTSVDAATPAELIRVLGPTAEIP